MAIQTAFHKGFLLRTDDTLEYVQDRGNVFPGDVENSTGDDCQYGITGDEIHPEAFPHEYSGS